MNAYAFNNASSVFQTIKVRRKNMHKPLSSIFLIFCFVIFAAAQSDNNPRAEFFGGYSVLKINYEPEIPNPPIGIITAFDGKQTLNGFNVSATGYIAKGFGLVGDFSGHFTTDRTPLSSGGNIENKIRVLNVLAGPQYKFRNSSRVAPFVRALAGVANTRSELKVPNFNVKDVASSTDFALAVGGGVDVRVSERIDLRVIQADYNPVFLSRRNELGFGKTRADNIRFSFGIVFK